MKPAKAVVSPVVWHDPRKRLPQTNDEWDRYVSDLLFGGGPIALQRESMERIARLLTPRR